MTRKNDINFDYNAEVKQILIACMDGLKGLPQATKTVFQLVNIQTCIVHKIRNYITKNYLQSQKV